MQATDDGTHRRLEGLIGAIAARSRELREPFDEEHTREAFGAGELTLGCLQARADELESALEAAPRPRSRSHRTERPDLTDEEHHAWLASGRNPAAVRRLRETRETAVRGGSRAALGVELLFQPLLAAVFLGGRGCRDLEDNDDEDPGT